MTDEDYCSYELSQLLKEKGFDGECMGCYWDSKQIFDINYEPLSYSDGDLRDEVILAPTHQMAMKWLREKWIFIEISFSVTTNGEPCYNFGILSRSAQWVYRHKQSFSTYEEAVEAALKHVLENLI